MVQDNRIQGNRMVTRSLGEASGKRVPACQYLFLRVFRTRLPAVVLLAFSLMMLPACVFLQNHTPSSNLLPTGEQPDKILYEKSLQEIKHGRYDIGRLTLQTLLNTYPDSEYLAKAKLAIANSYYQQGGVSGLTESESEYKDFITFFPTAPEAPMAQFRVAMAHFRLMGKPDRDRTEARLAEAEFKEFLLKYSDSHLMPRVKARLRQVQEVLAEGEYEIALFYYEKGANPAAVSRLKDLINRYPNFSMGGRACWYLAQTYQRIKKPKDAIPYYDRILTDYPLSPLAGNAKQELANLHQPIPQPTLATLARARADAMRQIRPSLMHRVTAVFSSDPDLQATRHGPVILGNPSSATEMANNPQPRTATGNALGIQRVGESALRNSKAADPKANSKTSTAANKQGTSKEKAGSHSSDQAKGQASAKKKKKGHRSLFKKVINPF